MINAPTVHGWPDWLLILCCRRFAPKRQPLIVRLQTKLPRKLARSVTLYADAIVVDKLEFKPTHFPAELTEISSQLPSNQENWNQLEDRCMRYHANSLLWIDPNVFEKSPAMKALVVNAGKILDHSSLNLKLWCHVTTLPEKIAWHQPMAAFPQRALAAALFPSQVALRQLLWFVVKGGPPAALIHSSITGFWRGDITTVHFLYGSYLKVIGRHLLSCKFVPAIVLAAWAALADQIFYRLGASRLFLTVGRRVAENLKKLTPPSAIIRVLPSCYNDVEFTPDTRQKHRQAARRNFKFQDEDIVLAFACQGGYRRKGFFLVAEALDILWNKGYRDYKVILFGGNGEAISKLKKDLSRNSTHWEKWLVVAGWVDSLAHAMSAADAFVFPSYFESFAAVEAEASALGLPLLLSDHWGSEMVLQPGKNGVTLPLDGKGIAEELLKFEAIRSTMTPIPPKATPNSNFAEEIAAIYNLTLSAKRGVKISSSG